jgi:hypothetical protein
MTELAPATLQRLVRVGKPAKNKPAKVKLDGIAFPVQFNPATLKISRRNNVDRSGTTAKTQKAQRPSSEPATLTFDLEFDTAEQGTARERVDVRKWTALVRQFVELPPAPGKGPPPAVQFQWGSLVFKGIIEQLTEELDHFAPDGTPLHAKVNVTISEQDFALEALQGEAAKDAKAARDPGATNPGTSPGSSGTDKPVQVVDALDGESAQQLLSRLGKDPAAWRAAMSDLDSPLGLTAGEAVPLGIEVDAGPGIGVTAHFTADAAPASPDRLAEALGLGVPGQRVPAQGLGTGTVDSRGFALSAAGGIARAVTRVERATTEAQVAASRGAFDVPVPAVSADVVVDVVDPRASTFGRGVPLQFRMAPAREGPNGPTPGREQADSEQRRRDAGASTLRWRPGR